MDVKKPPFFLIRGRVALVLHYLVSKDQCQAYIPLPSDPAENVSAAEKKWSVNCLTVWISSVFPEIPSMKISSPLSTPSRENLRSF